MTGLNWDTVGLSDASVRDITIDKKGTIYACTMINATGPYGVFRSTDYGNTWENFWQLTYYSAPYGGITSNSYNQIFLGAGDGVYRSTGSSFWNKISDDQIDAAYSLTIGSDSILYAGSYSQGIFRGGVEPAIIDTTGSYDLFSLAKGNNYKYNYQYSDSIFHIGDGLVTLQIDSGIILYSIIDSSFMGDRIEWLVERNIELLERKWDFFDSTYQVQQKDTFLLNESLYGNHELVAHAPVIGNYIGIGFWQNDHIWDFPALGNIKVYRYHKAPSNIFLKYYDDTICDSLWFDDKRGLYKRKHYDAIYGNHDVICKTEINLIEMSVGIKEKTQILQENFHLSQNYPNPFNPTTSISYSVPKTSFVAIKVFDILGREVGTLVNEEKAAGNYKVNFEASNLSSGVYFYSIRAGDYVETKKMVLIR